MNRLIVAMVITACMVASAGANWGFVNASTPDMFWPPDHSNNHSGPYASCVAWGDVTGDGYPDLFVGARNGGGCSLYRSDRGQLRDVSDRYGVENITGVISAQFVDYDNDGGLDLLCLTDGEVPVELYHLNSSSRYQPVDLGLDPGAADRVRSAIWTDLDSDGYLDILMTSLDGTSGLMGLMQLGETQFSPARAGELPVDLRGISTISAVDFDMDGDVDIFTGTAEATHQAHVFVNYDGNYQDEIRELELARDIGAAGMAWADFNHDGYLDFVTCGTADQTYLYMGTPVNRRHGFVEVFHNPLGNSSMATMLAGAISVHTVDANQDGWTDIFFVRPDAPGNVLLVNQRGCGWDTEGVPDMILHTAGGTQSCAWGDYDLDGDLDVAIPLRDGGIRVYNNVIREPHEHIALRLVDPITEAPLMNCQIVARFEDCKQWATTSLANATLGFNDMTRVLVNPTRDHSIELTVFVIWPDGDLSTYEIEDINLWGVTTLSPPASTTDRSDLVHVTDPGDFSVDLTSSPNPFNPVATIHYTIPEAADVRLTVYNLLGREVALLESGEMEAGAHVVRFDASALPSGLYIARLEAAGETRLHRMLLTK